MSICSQKKCSGTSQFVVFSCPAGTQGSLPVALLDLSGRNTDDEFEVKRRMGGVFC